MILHLRLRSQGFREGKERVEGEGLKSEVSVEILKFNAR